MIQITNAEIAVLMYNTFKKTNNKHKTKLIEHKKNNHRRMKEISPELQTQKQNINKCYMQHKKNNIANK